MKDFKKNATWVLKTDGLLAAPSSRASIKLWVKEHKNASSFEWSVRQPTATWYQEWWSWEGSLLKWTAYLSCSLTKHRRPLQRIFIFHTCQHFEAPGSLTQLPVPDHTTAKTKAQFNTPQSPSCKGRPPSSTGSFPSFPRTKQLYLCGSSHACRKFPRGKQESDYMALSKGPSALGRWFLSLINGSTEPGWVWGRKEEPGTHLPESLRVVNLFILASKVIFQSATQLNLLLLWL